MTPTRTGSLSRKALVAALAAALTLTTAGVAPARADNNKEAIAAAALLGLLAVGIIATTRDGRAYTSYPPAVTTRRSLPAECRFDIHRGADRGTWYGRRCLSRNNIQLWSVPDSCVRRVELPRRHRDVIAYSAHCLARLGSGPSGGGHGGNGRGDRH